MIKSNSVGDFCATVWLSGQMRHILSHCSHNEAEETRLVLRKSSESRSNNQPSTLPTSRTHSSPPFPLSLPLSLSPSLSPPPPPPPPSPSLSLSLSLSLSPSLPLPLSPSPSPSPSLSLSLYLLPSPSPSLSVLLTFRCG